MCALCAYCIAAAHTAAPCPKGVGASESACVYRGRATAGVCDTVVPLGRCRPPCLPRRYYGAWSELPHQFIHTVWRWIIKNFADCNSLLPIVLGHGKMPIIIIANLLQNHVVCTVHTLTVISLSHLDVDVNAARQRQFANIVSYEKIIPPEHRRLAVICSRTPRHQPNAYHCQLGENMFSDTTAPQLHVAAQQQRTKYHRSKHFVSTPSLPVVPLTARWLPSWGMRSFQKCCGEKNT